MFLRKNQFLFRSTFTILLLHVVGIIGICSSQRELFLSLTPLNLIITGVVLFINQEKIERPFLLFVLGCVIAGYLVELVGIKTGTIFGNYSYGETLGPKLLDVPVVIGINWALLICSAGSLLDKLNVHFIIKSSIGAFILVCLDMLMEPVAIKFNFWSWADGVIPIRNYIAWFVFAFMALALYYKMDFQKKNRFSPILLSILFLFFATLCFIK